MKAKSALSVALAAGLSGTAFAGADERPTFESRTVAHIYYNLASGETIVTPYNNGINPAITDTNPVYIADNGTPCAPFGDGGIVGIVEDPNNVVGFGSFTGSVQLDWADVAPDTVVDGFTFSISPWHQDEPGTGFDTDGDTVPDIFIGDGIEGFAMIWGFYGGESGGQTARELNVAYAITGLPGDPNNFSAGGTVISFLLTVDLEDVDGMGTTNTFEIGDSDGVQLADNFIDNIFNDPFLGDAALDNNGLADFGYAFNYVQPGTVDFDGDTVADGDPGDQAPAFYGLDAPLGTVSFDEINIAWVINRDPSPANMVGSADVYDLYPSDVDGDTVPDGLNAGNIDTANFGFANAGGFFFGGFNCTGPDLDGDTLPDDFNGDTVPDFPDYDPYTQFTLILFGPGDGGGCASDLNDDDTLDFFDVSAFLADFNSACTPGVGDFNNSGACDFFDVSAFLADFNTCVP